jgi:hypothetical protein
MPLNEQEQALGYLQSDPGDHCATPKLTVVAPDWRERQGLQNFACLASFFKVAMLPN